VNLLHAPLLWKVVCALLMPLSLWFGIKRMSVARAIADTPVSRVRSAAQGYVAISGTAQNVAEQVGIAPLTGLPSVWWYYRIEQRSSSRNDRDGWTVVTTATSDEMFLVSDDTARCAVDPEGAQVYPAIRKVWYGSQDWPAPALGSTGVFAAAMHRFRYTEHRIPVGCNVHVMGEFRTVSAVDHGAMDAEVADLLRRWKSDQRELLRRFDTNNDGVISAAEWEQARRTAREYVQAEQTTQPQRPALNTLSASNDGRPFLIAGVDPQALVSKARWQAWAAWLLFVTVSGVLFWLI
jgi:hypothetical protein